jgi:G3E family GTPase
MILNLLAVSGWWKSLEVVQIAGFLGSGKTTTIIALTKQLAEEYKKKVAIIVNEIGDVPVDAKVVNEFGLQVKDIGGGCICCELLINLAFTLEELSKGFNPDIVFVEPSGVSIPSLVKDGIKTAKGTEIKVGPVVVIFDAEMAEEQLSDEGIGNFVLRQLSGADIVAVNKVDVVDEAHIKAYEEKLKTVNPDARLVRISAQRGIGLKELMHMIMDLIAAQ